MIFCPILYHPVYTDVYFIMKFVLCYNRIIEECPYHCIYSDAF